MQSEWIKWFCHKKNENNQRVEECEKMQDIASGLHT